MTDERACTGCDCHDTDAYTFAPGEPVEEGLVWLCPDCYDEMRVGEMPRPLHLSNRDKRVIQR